MRQPSNHLTSLILWILLCSAVTSPVLAQSGAPTVSLLQNGTFTAAPDKWPVDWNEIDSTNPATVGTEGTDRYITAVSSDEKSVVGLTQTIPVRSEWAKLLLRGYIRVIVDNSHPLPATAFIGVNFSFQDKTGKPIGMTAPQSWLTMTPGWVEINQLVDLPVGAESIVISPEIKNASATAYFKTLSLVAFVQTFTENFSGNLLDANVWNVSIGKHNVAANELEWFTRDNVTVANNMLDIHGAKRNDQAHPYSSGQISTLGKFQQLYGIFEFDEKLPVTSGAWPAAYLLRYDDCWPPEIDVEELAGDKADVVLETNHYADDNDIHRSSNVNFSSAGLDRTQWHKYTIVWEPGAVAWYIDDIYKGTTGEPFDRVSDDPMYITLNMAIGWFGGDPSVSSWPQDFFCRGIKVYQRTDLPLPVYAQNSQEITLPNKTVNLDALTCVPNTSAQVTWSLVEGAGPVQIKDPHLVSTTAIIKKSGMYKFRITVSVGATSTSADLLAYVDNAVGSK